MVAGSVDRPPRTLTAAVALAAGTLLVAGALLAACGSSPAATGSAASPAAGSTAGPSHGVPQLANVSLHAERATSVVVGSDGGALETTDATGASYRVTIPPGALREDTKITAVPVSGVAGLPSPLEVAAGLHLLPDGLELWAPAEIQIHLASPRGPIVPFAYRSDMIQPFRYPASVDGAAITLAVVHFSGYALLGSTDQAMAAEELGLQIPWAPPDGAFDAALANLAMALNGPVAARADKSNAAMRTLLESALRPAVEQFRTVTHWSHEDPWASASYVAAQGIDLWSYLEKLLVLAGIGLEPGVRQDFGALAVSAATHAIAVANSDCGSSPTGVLLVLRLPELLGWQERAVISGIANLDPTLDLQFVMENLCVQVEFDPNGGTDFPAGVQPGQTGTLSVRAGLRIDGTEVRYESLRVRVTPHGAIPDDVVEANTSANGEFSHTFAWDPAAPELRLDIQACLLFVVVPVCQDAFVVRGMPAASCPRFSLDANGVTKETDKFDGVSINQGDAGGAIGGEMTFSLAAFDAARISARGTLHYTVDASQAGGSSFEVGAIMAVAWENYTGGAASVTVTVDGVAKTFAIPSGGAREGDDQLRFPLVVAHGQSFAVDVVAEARAASDRSVGLTGTLNFQLKGGGHPSDHSLYINEQTCA